MIQIDAVWVSCDECGECEAMSHTNICAKPIEFKKATLEFIKTGFEHYDLHGWKVFANANVISGNDILCGDCLKNKKKGKI